VVDEQDCLEVAASGRPYRLRRVWLDSTEERRYYEGFANEGLWPLCHRAHVQPIFRADDFKTYQTVNARFAEAVSDEVDSQSPLILVQDYHFALAPRAIRERLPLSTIIAFWHIPWPHPSDYAVCPWGRELLTGLLGSTIVGFQTPEDCQSFMDTVDQLLDAHIDRRNQVITHHGQETTVRAYPVSIEWPSRWTCQAPPVGACRADVRRELHLTPNIRLAVGVDRLDYTKGLNEKFLAVERFLELNPEWHERFVLVQVAEPSRQRLASYQAYRNELRETAERINTRFGSATYRPIILREAHHEPADVYRFLRAADICYVGSLHDGMNLVAKEFVAARDDSQGVLLLSQFAGAARELAGALIINPYAIDKSARTLEEAMRMSPGEQMTRMCAMRSTVADLNAYRWAVEMLMDASRVRTAEAKSGSAFSQQTAILA
jgi:trehalose 6-phosphate synthase